VPRRRRSTSLPLAGTVLAALVVAPLLASCGSDAGGSDEGASGGIATAIVADSEVPEEVADLVADADGISVTVASSADGATMAELDPAVDAALADGPDVLVYAGGTNDLPAGPAAMLAGLEERLGRYAEEACVVVAVPIFRFRGTTDEEIAAETAGTRLLEDTVAAAGARPVSYLDLALEMRAEGEDFFAEGELGDLHPGPAAYPRIAAAIADEVRACPGG
jgi:lysophospholipase L1-like esterase